MHYDVLMVDDEQPLAVSTTEYLTAFGVSAAYVTSAEDADEFLAENEVDLVLLDINLPGASGFEFCRRLRARSDVPLVFLSARGADDDQVLALSIGGDDYVRKPYSLGVLLAKIRRILERHRTTAGRGGQAGYDDGWLQVDQTTDRVYLDGAEVTLTAMEHRLLRFLVDNSGRVLTKQELFEHVWPEAIASDGTLTVHIRRLRTKIERDPDQPRYIQTAWGRGYLFEDAR